MPYVEGESLRDRLTREKQLPIPDAVRFAIEVAEALDYAHQQGVIHRDIKPENILLHDAQALVADFGIALAASRAEGGSRMTETGMSLGTPHYMSPEQAMGERNLDARTDVYALGCVLYEMLTGEPPFTGPTAQAIVARVMTEVPRSVTLQRKAVPPHVEAAVLTALEKLPADRFATAAEFLTALGDTSRRTAPGGSGAAAGTSRMRRAVPWVVALLALGVAGVSMRRLAQVPVSAPLRFTLAPHGADVSSGGGLTTSPDGRTIVYAASVAGVQRLYRRTLDNPLAVPLIGTEGVREAAFSPDGRWVLFSSADDRIKKIPVEGGTVVSLVRTTAPAGITWSAGIGPVFGMPSFSRDYHGLTSVPERGDTGLHLLTSGNGPPRAGADSTRGGGGGMDHEPFALQDGRTVLFSHHNRGGAQLGVLSLADKRMTLLDLPVETIVGLADGVLLYLDNDESLMAVEFDAGRRRLSGAPIR
ncbi:MAG TPA: protein kinase, partial [Gemmatimonadales bacterium]|nr:protein kinase [Gemmatimonadales bacterium]